MLCLAWPVRDSGSVKEHAGSGTLDGDDDGEVLIALYVFRGLADIRSCKTWLDEEQSVGLTGFGLDIAKVTGLSSIGENVLSTGNTFLCFFVSGSVINSNGFGGRRLFERENSF